MNNLLKFIIKYHFYFLFLLIELLCIFLIVQNNKYHKAGFLNSSNFVTGNTQNVFNNATAYFDLKAENERLAAENALLHSQVENVIYTEVPVLFNDTLFRYDSLLTPIENPFQYQAALVISNSTNKLHNILMIDKGEKQNINNEMAVVNTHGVVGIVTSTSNNFSTIMPVINQDFNLSAKVKDQGYFGNVQWDGKDPQYAQLKEVPNHVQLEKGDTIVTSGYSHIFPEGIVVGYVESSSYIEGNYFIDVTIKLAVNFAKLDYVYAIENKAKEEMEGLQNEQ
ncbi:MAG: rod shape-determining protein MreC [Chitinophagales bacterium]